MLKKEKIKLLTTMKLIRMVEETIAEKQFDKYLWLNSLRSFVFEKTEF